MQVKKLQTLNFQGLKDKHEWELDPLIILCDNNRAGKSSFLNAIKFGITGDEPSDAVYGDANRMAVGLTLSDGEEDRKFIRQRMDGTNTWYMDGKKVTKKILEQGILDTAGTTYETLKVATSEDVLKTMQPKAFGDLILSYTDDKLDRDAIVEMMPEATPDMIDEIWKRLPEGLFGIATLDSMYEKLNEDRLTMKRFLDSKEDIIKAIHSQPKPGKTKEQFEEDEKKLQDKVNEANLYAEKWKAYQKAKEINEKNAKTIEEYKKKIEENKAVQMDTKERETLETVLKSLRETEQTARTSIVSMEHTVDQTKKILERLDTTICPLSEKLTCTTDKTQIRTELETLVKNNETEIGKLEETLKQTDAKMKEQELKIREFDKNQSEYEKKCFMQKEVDRISKLMVEVPPEPKKPEVVNADEMLKKVRKEIHVCDDYARAEMLEKKVSEGKKVLERFTKLCKLFKNDGLVREEIIRKYMVAFEEICNAKAAKLLPGMNMKFVPDSGVKVYLDTGDGIYKSYNSLSGGEKALYIFLMLDMLNALSGLGILIIDELSVLDRDSFAALIDLILAHKDEYNQVVLSMVNHDDTVQVLKDRGLKIMDLETT